MGNVQAAPRHAAKIYSAPRASAQRVSLAIYERTLLKFRLIVQGRSTRSRTRKREREANEVRSVLLSSRTTEKYNLDSPIERNVQSLQRTPQRWNEAFDKIMRFLFAICKWNELFNNDAYFLPINQNPYIIMEIFRKR